MKSLTKSFLGFLLISCLILSITVPFASASTDTLLPSDFEQESWAKTVDYFDYVRSYAYLHGMTAPPPNWQAFLYLTYVNISGLQMMYGGLSNITITTEWEDALTIPIQTWMMHYKSKDNSEDVVTAGSFIMLMTFSEDDNSIYDDSPDMNDTLYSSFNLGINLVDHFDSSAPPSLSTVTKIIELESSPDKLNWSWGMQYLNLTAIWWRTYIDPSNPHTELLPIAITRYDELTFTYDLTIDPDSSTATLTANYIIGKMTDLWIFPTVFGWLLPQLFAVHYNSTGCYKLNGVKESDETIYEFLQEEGIKMSIVQFQSTVVLDHTVYSSSQGSDVTDEEVEVGDSSISTITDDGEKIFEAYFDTKQTYNLYNYTEDHTESIGDEHETVVRTCKIAGFANNGIFSIHTSLMRHIPLVVAHMDPELYQQAKDHLLDWSYADYFYLISYLTYSGYRIEHDPTYTAYLTIPSYKPSSLSNSFTLIIFIALVTTVVCVTIVVFLFKRKGKRNDTMLYLFH